MTWQTILLATLPLLASFHTVYAQQTCNSTSLCGIDSPCCSEFGFCGAGTYCLGGCNPLFSHALDSCMPEPLCKSTTYKFDATLSSVVNATLYNGNSSSADWTLDQGVPQGTKDNELVLTLSENGGGTRLSTTSYVHYATITASVRTGKWKGVVTAFITMSGSHDEIDWEWPGADVLHGQSNYFWLGVANYSQTHGGTHNVSSDTSANYHDYTIDWQPDALTFSIDGNVVRTVKKTDTLNPATGTYEYPTTPARVQLSLWPAGIPGNAQGTIDWSGGLIDWNDPDYVSAGGHFYAFVKSVSVKCADGVSAASPALAVPAGAQGYIYGQNVSGVPAVLTTNASTIIGAAGRGVVLSAGAVVASVVGALVLGVFGAMI